MQILRSYGHESGNQRFGGPRVTKPSETFQSAPTLGVCRCPHMRPITRDQRKVGFDGPRRRFLLRCRTLAGFPSPCLEHLFRRRREAGFLILTSRCHSGPL
jgi:hypothetical protein